MTEIRFYPGALQRLFQSTEGPVGRDLARRAVRVQTAAKRYAPVKTGLLRSSIVWEIQRDFRGLYALVGTDVEYAPYQEFGTSRMPAHPFLRPALAAAR